MAKKISQLTAIDAVADGDLFEVVDDPGGTPTSKKATRTQIVATCEKLVSKGVALGYASLGADGIVPSAQLPVIPESGNETFTGADGAEPAATSGDLYLPNNGMHLERYSGSAWVPWGPLYPMVRPISGNFAWINQGGASVDQTNGGIHLLGPADASTNWRIRKKAKPSTTFTITAAFLITGFNAVGHQFGLIFRESGSGKIHTFQVEQRASGHVFLGSEKWTSPTVFSAEYSALETNISGLVWLRIQDDGTNRKCSISPDGAHWTVFHSVTRLDFLTVGADEVGFGVDTENATYGEGVTLVSWQEGA